MTPACYEATITHDPLMHQRYILTDTLGRVGYNAVDTGNSPTTRAWYTEDHYTYDAVGNAVKITQSDGSATTFTYDAAGRQLTLSDPDRGSESYAYDANGNVALAARSLRAMMASTARFGATRRIPQPAPTPPIATTVRPAAIMGSDA